MPELGESRRKLKIALGVMVAVDVLAVGILVSPLVGSSKGAQIAARSGG